MHQQVLSSADFHVGHSSCNLQSVIYIWWFPRRILHWILHCWWSSRYPTTDLATDPATDTDTESGCVSYVPMSVNNSVRSGRVPGLGPDPTHDGSSSYRPRSSFPLPADGTLGPGASNGDDSQSQYGGAPRAGTKRGLVYTSYSLSPGSPNPPSASASAVSAAAAITNSTTTTNNISDRLDSVQRRHQLIGRQIRFPRPRRRLQGVRGR